MTEFDSDDDDAFEVSADPETVLPRAANEPLNVCRVAALSARFSDRPEVFQPVAGRMAELGLTERVTSPERIWSSRRILRAFDLLGPPIGTAENRSDAWLSLTESGRPAEAVRFLVDVLGSPLERESTAAAAALWRILEPELSRGDRRNGRRWPMWAYLLEEFGTYAGEYLPWLSPSSTAANEEPDEPIPWDASAWQQIFRVARFGTNDYRAAANVVAELARWRLSLAARSADSITVSLAAAAFELSAADDGQATGRSPRVRSESADDGVSTMIHGTAAWRGSWWRPKTGDFHTFVLQTLRPNLFSGGTKFSWSGALRERDRILAAGDFCDWADDVAPGGLQSVFGHSYGGEVAARAALMSARTSELILLSTPVTPWVELAASHVDRLVDVRLNFDPVLALARTAQKLRPGIGNVDVVELTGWRIDHGATHKESVWRKEKIAEHGKL